jgi:uncharacterized membrane protein YedE/YeeE
MELSKKNKIIYWCFTTPIVGMMLISSYGYLTSSDQMVHGITHLGYPLYFMKILGPAKLLGVLAILFNKAKTLKEWAYAGFCFTFIGASISHFFSGDGAMSLIPLIFLALLLGSHKYWKLMRK